MSWFSVLGAIFCALGSLLTVFNFHLAFLRYPIHRILGGTQSEYRNISGIPVVGSLFLYSVLTPLEK